ncbi:hypothetical protein [Streptomyces sp. NPDC006668]
MLLHPSTGGGRPAGESTGCMITRYTNDRYRKSMVLWCAAAKKRLGL